MGYRRVHKQIEIDYGWVISANLVFKVRKELNMTSIIRKKKYPKLKGSHLEHIKYSNLLKGDFSTSRPFEKVCTDTTMIGHKGKIYDLNLYIDLFNNEIISYDLSPSNYGHGHNNHYNLMRKFKEEKEKRGYINVETILHSDQGPIYTSQAFNAQFDNTTIVRSMSRAGKPTDNPIIESFNGWMKNELEYDFKYKDKEDVYQVIEESINYHNNIRLSYALEYKNPHQYKTDMGYA